MAGPCLYPGSNQYGSDGFTFKDCTWIGPYGYQMGKMWGSECGGNLDTVMWTRYGICSPYGHDTRKTWPLCLDMAFSSPVASTIGKPGIS